MARRRRTRSATRTITRVVRSPSPVIRVAAPAARYVRRRARRAGKRAGIHRKQIITSPMVYTVAGAGLLGYLERTGTKIPSILPNTSPAFNAGLLALGAHYFLGVRNAREVATGMLCIAVNRWAANQVPGGAVIGMPVYGDDFDDGVEGDDDYDDG